MYNMSLSNIMAINKLRKTNSVIRKSTSIGHIKDISVIFIFIFYSSTVQMLTKFIQQYRNRKDITSLLLEATYNGLRYSIESHRNLLLTLLKKKINSCADILYNLNA